MKYQTFEQLMQENGLSAYKVSKDTGISQSTLSDWKMGKITPKADKMEKLEDYFSKVRSKYDEPVTVHVNLKKDTAEIGTDNAQAALNTIAAALNINPLDNLSNREKRLLTSFSLLTDDMQDSFLAMIESTAKNIRPQS